MSRIKTASCGVASAAARMAETCSPSRAVRSFEFKAVSPLFDTAEFSVNGRLEGTTARLWARGPQGQLAMQASAEVE